jgi:hypothetical protein
MDMSTRRRGVFLTPLPFAKKAYEYIERTLGEHWRQSGNYRLWDMAAGTGHLELFLPKDALPYCYLSTLEQKDVRHLEKTFPTATVFQYDYLNDDVEYFFGSLQKQSTTIPPCKGKIPSPGQRPGFQELPSSSAALQGQDKSEVLLPLSGRLLGSGLSIPRAERS